MMENILLIIVAGVLVLASLIVIFWDNLSKKLQRNEQKPNHTGSENDPPEINPEKTVGHAISNRIYAVAYHLRAQNEQQKRQDDNRTIREWITIRALIITGVFALFSDFILGLQLRDARQFADRQHEDTVAALALANTANINSREASSTQIAEMIKQSNAMSGQLSTMKGQLDLTKSFMVANIRQENINYAITGAENGSIKGFIINPVFRNVGPTDARNLTTYWHIYIDKIAPDATKDCQMEAGTRPTGGHPTTAAPGLAITLGAIELTIDDAMLASQEKASIYMYGHIEYDSVLPDDPRHIYDWCILFIPNDIQRNVFSPITIKAESH